jgi:transposase
MRMKEKVAYVGLDCHKNFSRMTARDAGGEIVFRQRLEHADRAALREELRRLPRGTPAILEGTFGWGWFSDELADCHLDPHLANSRKTAAWREARGIAKNNKLDADLLSELWPQPGRWWEVWLAPQEVRDQREWLRYRMTLVKMQTGLKNRIHATLHRHGILHGLGDLFGKAGRLFLWQLCQGDEQRPLRASGKETLKGYLKLLDQIRRQLASLTRLIRKTVSSSEQGERWRSLPGISWVLAYTILAEVGRCDRFAGAKQLSSYALLAPRADDSGDEDDQAPKGRHVGHAGRKTLKWAFIEAAHGAVRKSAYFRAIYDRRTSNGTRDKNRGSIAVAHELCRIGFSCWRNGRDYCEQRPQRPSRPGSPPPPALVESPPTETSPEKTSRAKISAETISPETISPSAPPAKPKNSMRLKMKRKVQSKGKELIQGKTSDKCELTQASRPGTGGSDHPMVAAAQS